MNILDGFYSLSRDINTVDTDTPDETLEGVVSQLEEELTLDIDDEELITLKNQWEADWLPFAGKLKEKQDLNENYWLGSQFGNSKDKNSPVDNLIFEALETFLPMATRQRAEPIVEGSNTVESQQLADTVRKMLIYQTDNLKLNLKIKQVARYWALYMLGCMKVGWSNATNDITCVTVRPQKLILDPDATIAECEYTGEYIGEYRKDTARNLIEKYPKKSKYIKELVQGKMGTKVQYIEWWTNAYVFWTLNDEVLDKKKNPHWMYNGDNGEEAMNHFPFPMMPYTFLSIFNLGLHPVDDTNLIQQNISMQDLINKRLRQIDRNADKTNGGLAVSGDSFTKDQAANISKAVEQGGTIFVPSGDVNTAVGRLSAPPLPNFVYESLLDYRNELRNIFGTRGSTAQGTVSEQTVRGKMLIKGQDADRIGGGVSIFIEQFADSIFNWFTQLMYVYYDEPHSASIVGQSNASEYLTLRSSDFNSKLLVSVKEGSMLPRDPLTRRNEAIDLWGSGGIDPITFFERLDFPNPKEAARNLYLWKSNPEALFGDQQQQQMPPEQMMMMEQGGMQIPQQESMMLGGMEESSLAPVG